MVKIYVLDLGVLLHCPEALFRFEDNFVVLPIAVIEGLNAYKDGFEQINYNARKAMRLLAGLMGKRRSFKKGIATPDGGSIRIEVNCKNVFNAVPRGIDFGDQKHRILAVAYNLSYTKKGNRRKGKKVILVSKDINLRLKADSYRIPAQDFESDRVKIEDIDHYTGIKEVLLDDNELDAVLTGNKGTAKLPDLCANEFLKIDCPLLKTKVLMRKRNDLLVKLPETGDLYGIKPKNLEQQYCFDLLVDPSVQVMTIAGPAGTGKTLLALIAGLELSGPSKLYDGVIVWRAIMPVGNDIGYLPGDKDEKILPWMKPVYDNLLTIVSEKNKEGYPYEKGTIKAQIDKLLKTVISLEALTCIRGRSIAKKFIIVDEAQNLTPHEIKTIISRAGEGTKVVLTGDTSQIDFLELDASSNGLVHVIKRLRGQGLYGHVVLKKTERSALAEVAVEFL